MTIDQILYLCGDDGEAVDDFDDFVAKVEKHEAKQRKKKHA